MRRNFKIIIAIIIIIIALAGAYLLLTPQYKQIEMSGYILEVPTSNADVENITENYNVYDDKENNLSIKTWAWKNTNDTNVDGVSEIGKQWTEGISSSNTTNDGISLYNKSGTYTYYYIDATKANAIVITSNNIDEITHIVKTMQKSNITPSDDINMTLNITNDTANDTNNNSTTTTTYSTKKTTSKSSKSSSNKALVEGVDYDSSQMSVSEYNSKVKNNPGGFYDLEGNYYRQGEGQ